jgi:hypothetical protein
MVDSLDIMKSIPPWATSPFRVTLAATLVEHLLLLLYLVDSVLRAASKLLPDPGIF